MDSETARGERANSDAEDEETEAILRAAAAKLKISYARYCREYGIIDAAHRRRIRRHEVGFG